MRQNFLDEILAIPLKISGITVKMEVVLCINVIIIGKTKFNIFITEHCSWYCNFACKLAHLILEASTTIMRLAIRHAWLHYAGIIFGIIGGKKIRNNSRVIFWNNYYLMLTHFLAASQLYS